MVINTENNDCEGGKHKESGQQPKCVHLPGTFSPD